MDFELPYAAQKAKQEKRNKQQQPQHKAQQPSNVSLGDIYETSSPVIKEDDRFAGKGKGAAAASSSQHHHKGHPTANLSLGDIYGSDGMNPDALHSRGQGARALDGRRFFPEGQNPLASQRLSQQQLQSLVLPPAAAGGIGKGGKGKHTSEERGHPGAVDARKSLEEGGGEEEDHADPTHTAYDKEIDELMETSLLGRQGKWNMSFWESIRSRNGLLAAFLPCIAMGKALTLLEKEQAIKEPCGSLGLGRQGWQMCLITTALGIIAPIPCIWPTLSGLRYFQRKRMKRQYNFPGTSDRDAERRGKGKGGVIGGCVGEGDLVLSMCLPGCSLGQELSMLEKEAAVNLLRFPWESGESWDVRHLSTELPIHKVLIMGDRQAGKSAFFARLLGRGFDPAGYKEDTTVNLGFRIFTNAAMTPLGSIEFWDVPTEEYRAVESLVFKDFSVVVLTFTLLKQASFEMVKEAYSRLRDVREQYSGAAFRESFGERRWAKPVPCVLVATKCDILDEKSCKFYGEVTQFVAKHNLVFVKVSNRTGTALPKAFKAIMNQLVVSKEALLPHPHLLKMNESKEKDTKPLVMDR